MVGVVPTKSALAMAAEAELDLVEISPDAVPPVCRVMDYGKYKYQLQKKQHDQKRKTHISELKQLRIKTFRIDPHDLQIKLRKAREFLEEGHRLVVTVMFRARELSHMEMGEALLREKFAQNLDDIAKVESPARAEGKKMSLTLAPVPNLKKILEKRKLEADKAARKAQKELALENAPVIGSETEEADVEDDDFEDGEPEVE